MYGSGSELNWLYMHKQNGTRFMKADRSNLTGFIFTCVRIK